MSNLYIRGETNDYQFFGSVQDIGRQIGNAVPVLLAQRIGEYIRTEHKKTDEENA